MSRRPSAYAVLWLARLSGGSASLAFLWFVFAGSAGVVDLGLDEANALWFDACLCLAFFVQHSGMIRRSFRQRLERFVAVEYHGALFSIVAGVVLLALIAFWQDSGAAVVAPAGVRWLQRAVGIASLAGLVWTGRALSSFDPFGVRPIVHSLRGTKPRPLEFTVRGPYRWVRHPSYLLLVVMIWSYPDITADRLLFNVSWTVWVWIGTMLEERDLVSTFGPVYREYQRYVPMLIPYRIPRVDRLGSVAERHAAEGKGGSDG